MRQRKQSARQQQRVENKSIAFRNDNSCHSSKHGGPQRNSAVALAERPEGRRRLDRAHLDTNVTVKQAVSYRPRGGDYNDHGQHKQGDPRSRLSQVIEHLPFPTAF
jgi:hypothetical protein